MALWDALGRYLGKSISDLLGARVRDRVPVYASFPRYSSIDYVVRAVAAANPFNPRLRASNWWMPLMDRFVPIEVPRPSVDEVMAFMGKVANAEMPGWVRELIEKYIDVITLRKAEQAAKYIVASMRRGRGEDAIKTRAERILQTTRRLITRERGE